MDLRGSEDVKVLIKNTTETLTIDTDSYDSAVVNALDATMTIAAPTGSPQDTQPLVIRIKDNGTSRTLNWNAAFRVIGVTLPTATTISKYHVIGCIYNAVDNKWDVIGVNEEA